MRHDYKFITEQTDSPRTGYRPGKSHIILVSAIAAGMLLGFSLIPTLAGANKTEDQVPVAVSINKPLQTAKVSESLALPEAPHINSLSLPLANEEDLNQLDWTEVKIKSGDSMARIFSRLKISPQTLHTLTKLGKETRKLSKITPGHVLKFQLDDDNQLQQLVYPYSITESLKITKVGTSYHAEILTKAIEKRIAHASAEITHSLFLAGQAAGFSDRMTMEFANIFGWDVDFALDIRKGDYFTVIYEEDYLDGKKIKDGEILAAEFHNNGKTYQAIRYEDSKGNIEYYSPDGKSMRKAFLRSPVNFSRISSRFNLGRKHPILNKIRAHKGVDYAARAGTPIKATGDGKIIFKGRKGGYGKTIIIKHGSAYSTLYAHMRNYNKKSRVGSRVKQGQVIGYIGSSGLATGPHLHYEFRLNGNHRNPLTVRLPTASPLPRKYREDFKQKADDLLAQLNLVKNNSVALLSE